MKREPALDEKVLLVARVLRRSRIRFAFGGALALAYYAEPRATLDIDLNVFLPSDRAHRPLECLADIGCARDVATLARVLRDGQVRMRWGTTPIDLFFATHAFHASCALRVRRVPFGDARIPILSPEDLTVFKVTFNRAKDWIDIEQMLLIAGDAFDVRYVETWLGELVGTSESRGRHFRAVARRFGAT